ncbi:uncharacterized protein LOC142977028 [Anticarsia gemmatalis]|uniref:uncharacterized protein LOC142977028 n=1 Tax=Anticarsia gemmatalis TaxID=129554 RepID=UPI003F771E6B
MRVEIPSCARCCFCMPLRYGLIVWGYLKLCMAGFILTGMSFLLKYMIDMYQRSENKEKFYMRYDNIDFLFTVVIIIVAAADIVLSLIFIVACHLKHLKLIKTYYFYSFFLLVLTAPLCLYNLAWMIFYGFGGYGEFHLNALLYSMTDGLILVAIIAIQVYVLLLVRSEIRKLDCNYQFRFENLAARAQTMINVENPEARTETITVTEK